MLNPHLSTFRPRIVSEPYIDEQAFMRVQQKAQAEAEAARAKARINFYQVSASLNPSHSPSTFIC